MFKTAAPRLAGTSWKFSRETRVVGVVSFDDLHARVLPVAEDGALRSAVSRSRRRTSPIPSQNWTPPSPSRRAVSLKAASSSSVCRWRGW